jgi:hypothetical protein
MRAFLAIIAVFWMAASGAAVGQQADRQRMEFVFLDMYFESVAVFVNRELEYVGRMEVPASEEPTGFAAAVFAEVPLGMNTLTLNTPDGEQDVFFEVTEHTKRVVVTVSSADGLQAYADEQELLLLD